MPTITSSKRKTTKKVADVQLAQLAQVIPLVSTTTETTSDIITTEGLLRNAQEAPKDKIYEQGT